MKTRAATAVAQLRRGCRVMVPGVDHPEDALIVDSVAEGPYGELTIVDKRGDEYQALGIGEVLIVT